MGNKVILKRSSVAAKTPTTGDLDYGELALNYTDGRLYYKTASNLIDYFSAGDGGGIVTNSLFAIFSYTATASQTTFTGADSNTNILDYAPGYLTVFINGIKISESDYTATNGTSVVLDTGASAGELVEIISFKTVNIWNEVTADFKTFKYNATASQTTFSGADANAQTLDYEVGHITVFLNGVKLTEDDYTATTGTSIVLDTGAALNDVVEVLSYRTLNLSDDDYVSTITGTTNQITVTGSGSVSADVTLSLPQNIHTAATPTFAGVTANTHTFTHGTIRSITLVTSATTVNQVLDGISASTFRSVKYQIQVTSSTSYHVTEVMVIHDGIDTFITEYGTIITGSSLATFTADVSGGNLRLLTTPTNAVTTYKVIATAINA
jgi:hypothetical protein